MKKKVLKKAVKKVVVDKIEMKALEKECEEVLKPTITEAGAFGNEDMQRLVAKVNEIIKFINK